MEFDALHAFVGTGGAQSGAGGDPEGARGYAASRRNSRRFALTIITSLGCNLDCPYCYEKEHPSILAMRCRRRSSGCSTRGSRRLRRHWSGAPPALRRAHPDRCVVERGAAVGRDRVGADQRVDADAAGVGVARPVAFDDHDAGLRRQRRPRAQADIAARIAETHQRCPRRCRAARRRSRGSGRAARLRASSSPASR